MLLPCGRNVGVVVPVPWDNDGVLEKGFLVAKVELKKTGVLPSNRRLVFGFLELPG